jgi:hypothetical protein
VSGPSPGPGIGWPRAKGLNSPRPPPRAPARHSHRPIETRDEAEPDGIVPTENAIGIVLVAGAKAVVAFLGPTIFDDDVVALEVAGFRKSLAKCSLVRPRGAFSTKATREDIAPGEPRVNRVAFVFNPTTAPYAE